jgi:predicted ABC-type ATPase
MIWQETIEGRPATVSSLTADFKPAKTKDGAILRVLFDDGGTAWLVDPELKKYDPDQPRDAGGKWTSGGGGGGETAAGEDQFSEAVPTYEVSSKGELIDYTPEPAGSATELFNRTYNPHYTADDLVQLSGAGDKIAAAEAKLAVAGPPTQEQFRDADGTYTPDRQAVHEQMLAKTFEPDAITAATPAAGEQPTFYVLGGRGGAGKSWFSKSPDSPFDTSKTIYVNTDDYKEALPEYEGWNAALVHEESSDIAESAHEIASRAGLNVTFDATLKSSGTITRLIDKYEKAGYRIEGYFMHTAPQVSTMRALGRFVHGGETGRYVLPQYVLGSTGNEKVFDSLAAHFAKYAVYDNNSSGGPKLVHEGKK